MNGRGPRRLRSAHAGRDDAHVCSGWSGHDDPSGSYRNHHLPSFEKFGGETGPDIPFPVSYTEAICPLLQGFGTALGFQLVLFTLDKRRFFARACASRRVLSVCLLGANADLGADPAVVNLVHSLRGNW